MVSEFKRYPLTYIIITLNVAVYLFSVLFGGSVIDMDMRALVDLGALYGPLTIADAQWWRLLSAMFLHGGGDASAYEYVFSLSDRSWA